VYDYIIATDEGGNGQDDEESRDSGTESEEEDKEGCVSLCISMHSPHSFLISHAFCWNVTYDHDALLSVHVTRNYFTLYTLLSLLSVHVSPP